MPIIKMCNLKQGIIHSHSTHRPCKVHALLVLSLTKVSSNMALFLDTSGVRITGGEVGEEAPPDTVTMP